MTHYLKRYLKPLSSIKTSKQVHAVTITQGVLKCLLFGFISVFSMCLFAKADAHVISPHVQNIEMNTSAEQSAQLSVSQLQARAKMWGLSITDYQHYRWLMQNTPSGKWYKQMNPAEVLALNAPDETTMMEYAKIVAQNTHARVSRELAFNKMYRQAYQLLYPNEKPIELAQDHSVLSASGALKAGDHVWLFTSLHNESGNLALQSLLSTIERSPNVTLDIYLVGKSLDKAAIEQWANQNAIPHELIDHSVTLNYGNARFKSIAQGKTMALPYVGLVRNHKFQPISLNSLM